MQFNGMDKEITLRAPDSLTKNQYKSKQREQVYDDMKWCCALAGLEVDIIKLAHICFCPERVYAAHLHLPCWIDVPAMVDMTRIRFQVIGEDILYFQPYVSVLQSTNRSFQRFRYWFS